MLHPHSSFITGAWYPLNGVLWSLYFAKGHKSPRIGTASPFRNEVLYCLSADARR